MNFFKERFSTLKFRTYLSLFLFILLMICFFTMLFTGNLDSIWFNSVEFLLLILINRMLYGFDINKKVLKFFLLFSESFFLFYIIFLFVYKEKHFITYRLLNIPAWIIFYVHIYRGSRLRG